MKRKVNSFPAAAILTIFIIAVTLVFARIAVAEVGTTVGYVNINTADVEELAALPGIGPSKAQAIVEHRSEHGPFPTVDSLADVRGIGMKLLERIRHLVTIEQR